MQVVVVWPTTVQTTGSLAEIQRFTASLDIPLYSIYWSARELVGAHLADPEFIDIGLAASQPYDISIIPLDSAHYAYLIADYDHEISGEPYQFTFAIGTGGKP